jgi:hypothetical protein
MEHQKIKNIISWVLQITAAVIMLQTLRYKFTAHPVSVWIFSSLGMEPWGRIGAGIAELIAGICLLIPKLSVYGALLGIGIMIGAVISHILVLGVEGRLFIMAIVTLFCCLGVVWIRRDELVTLIKNNELPRSRAARYRSHTRENLPTGRQAGIQSKEIDSHFHGKPWIPAQKITGMTDKGKDH